ncbi:CBO0543 family protein [Bacillus sp. SA1-12]|uniref:CBO0543 family protein n=1 Tax=Bacillus sp. SA1-12 TaxID=1455638 RepID=UPI000AFF74DF|nr:CBO0543 family protein [Bacillus sp. SA1-12]
MKDGQKQLEMQQHIIELNQMMIEDWQNNFVFTGEWWILLGLTIVPWFLWWKILDKRRILEILLFGLFVILTTSFLDVLGWNYSMWYYPNTLLALCTPLVPINYSLFPFFYMLIFQYFSEWKSFIVASIILSAIFSFIFEPLSEWINFYKELKWKHIYSFPIYILLGISIKLLVEKITIVHKKFT